MQASAYLERDKIIALEVYQVRHVFEATNISESLPVFTCDYQLLGPIKANFREIHVTKANWKEGSILYCAKMIIVVIFICY